jgi:uncharacterized protein (UPF0179 family)
MVADNAKVTLIGTDLAKPDLEFIYEGAQPECEGCKVFKVCNNLTAKKRYRIMGVRTGSTHECRLHHGGARVVEVIESPIVALINSERAIVNSKIQFESSCSSTACKSYDLCNPEGIIEGERYIVGEVLGNAPEGCERGRTLKLVELRPV